MHVFDRAQVELAFIGAVLGDVGLPDPVGCLSTELALDDVVMDGRTGSAVQSTLLGEDRPDPFLRVYGLRREVLLPTILAGSMIGGAVEGTPFGRYRLLNRLGRGGMGEVWRAYDADTDRVVAIKVLLQGFSSDSPFVERFRREAHSAARLHHPHIVPIYDYGAIEDGRLYVSMAYVRGRDLEDVLARGQVPPERAIDIVRQIGSALRAAHKIGLVHRDVKPRNILLDENGDYAYLIDFGIAKAVGEDSLTETGHLFGTWKYMAPERFQPGDSVDPRVDIYALTCVLYQSLTGRPPFNLDRFEQLITAHLTTPPPRPSLILGARFIAFDDVIATGMAKDPDQRYPTIQHLTDAAKKAVVAAGKLATVVESADNEEASTTPRPDTSSFCSKQVQGRVAEGTKTASLEPLDQEMLNKAVGPSLASRLLQVRTIESLSYQERRFLLNFSQKNYGLDIESNPELQRRFVGILRLPTAHDEAAAGEHSRDPVRTPAGGKPGVRQKATPDARPKTREPRPGARPVKRDRFDGKPAGDVRATATAESESISGWVVTVGGLVSGSAACVSVYMQLHQAASYGASAYALFGFVGLVLGVSSTLAMGGNRSAIVTVAIGLSALTSFGLPFLLQHVYKAVAGISPVLGVLLQIVIAALAVVLIFIVSVFWSVVPSACAGMSGSFLGSVPMTVYIADSVLISRWLLWSSMAFLAVVQGCILGMDAERRLKLLVPIALILGALSPLFLTAAFEWGRRWSHWAGVGLGLLALVVVIVVSLRTSDLFKISMVKHSRPNR